MKKLLILFLIILLTGCVDSLPINLTISTLPIPLLVPDENPDPNILEYTLTVQEGISNIKGDLQTPTLGYNGSLLGPTIYTEQGQEVIIHVINQLKEETTVHWHGLIVPGEMDGGPHQIVGIDETWSPTFVMDQPAATAWYHPHRMGTTAIQVYRGLAGLWIHSDEEEQSLNLPNTYGVDDIPLIVQDKSFANDGKLIYTTNMGNGFLGETIIVNGKDSSSLTIPTGWVRYRLLNGSNSEQHTFAFGNSFYQIASDGGLLEQPIQMTSLALAPGERAEVLVYNELERTEYFTVDGNKEVSLTTKGDTTNDYQLSETLVSIEDWTKETYVNTRTFNLEGANHMVSINGETFNMSQISFDLQTNILEKWTIRNTSGSSGMGMMGMMEANHSFHVHGLQYQVLSRNGKTPPENEQGWKDTVYLLPGEEAEILVRFTLPGIYMYHCHNLEHEDGGMMGQFEVIA